MYNRRRLFSFSALHGATRKVVVMTPEKSVRLAIGEAFAASTDVWTVAADPLEVALVAAPFTPSELMVLSDFTLATFTGSTPKLCQAPPQQAGIDPATQEQVVTALAPAGGWRWECTAAPATPETIYGFVFTNSAPGWSFCALLPTPVTIANVGDFIDLGALEMRFVLQPIS